MTTKKNPLHGTIRTVRFRPEELRLIDKFLDQNEFLDFSTLARMAITEFVKNPSIQITAIKPPYRSITAFGEVNPIRRNGAETK